MLKNEIEKILYDAEVDYTTIDGDLFCANLKEILTSLEFLKVIMSVEEKYGIEFDEETIKMETINFEFISHYVKR